MLPNWLYGKSKSKLASILGGGGGGASYTAGDGIDISDGVISFDPETTPAIDTSKIDGLDDDLAALAPKTALSNHNILHNPWFTVNQRASGKITAGGKYPCDRWKVVGEGTLDVTATENGLAVVNTSNETSVYIIQPRTTTTVNSLRSYNNKLTASVMLSNGTIYSGTAKVAFGTVTYFENDDMKASTIFNTTPGEVLRIEVKGGKSVTIRAIKLEVGEVSTLHLDPRPEYAIELAKCQRYFQRISGDADSIVDWGASVDGNTVRYCIHIREMRAKPTMSYSGVKCGNATPSSFTLMGYTSGRVQANAQVSSALTPDVPYRLLLASNGYIDFDAEI